MEADKQAIAVLVETYQVGFATLDADKLQSIWDRDYDIIYCPLELATPLRSWPAIAQYYQRVTQHFTHARVMEIANLSIDIVGAAAFAFFTFRFEGEVAGSGELHTAAGRNTLIFHRRNGVWQGIHYHESPPGPY